MKRHMILWIEAPTRFIIPVLMLTLPWFAVGCSSTADLTSTWRNNEILIDGQSSDWGSLIVPIKDTPIALGTLNDRDFLYLCIVSSDPQFQRQMMGLGLTVWFQPDGGERIGIHYPTGIRRMGRMPSFESDEGRDRSEAGSSDELAFSDLEILGPEKDDKTIYSPIDVPGVRVKIGRWRGSVVYEIKVPLEKSKDHPIALQVTPGGTIDLEIKGGTVEEAVKKLSQEGEGGAGEGRGGGMRGARGGGMRAGGRRGGGGQTPQNRPKPLDFEAVIHLAKIGADQASR